jgi:2-keto-4-pentenoate hydratase
VTHALVPPEILAGQRSLFMRMQREAPAGTVRVGWKIGHAIDEVDALGGELPVVGWISSATVLADGDAYAARGARALRGETELVIELARAVDPDAGDDALRDAIAGLRVALEIVDVGRPPYDPRGIIEGNLFHRAVVFGNRLAPVADTVGPATLRVNRRVHGQDDDPPCLLAAVRGVARMLDATGGMRLGRGDKILTGSLVHVPVSPGDDLRAEIDGLGRVSAHLRR